MLKAFLKSLFAYVVGMSSQVSGESFSMIKV